MIRSAIILAGGQSKRFQDKSSQWIDKALAMFFGKPLLVHVVENARSIVDEIIICVNEGTRGLHYLNILEKYSINGVKTCVDMKFPHTKGPLAAIATGLKNSNANYSMILPCDIPFIKPSVIDYLLKFVRDLDICIPIHPDGNIEALIFSCNRQRTLKVAETLCLLGRSKPIDIVRASSKIKLVSTNELKKLDPDLRSFTNINFREDLITLPNRVPKEGPVMKSIDLNLAQLSSQEMDFLEKIARKYANKEYSDVIINFSKVLSILEKKNFHFWAGVLWETIGKIFYTIALAKENTDEKREYCYNSKVAFEKAAQEYAAEANIYESRQIKFLLKNANEDKMWCLSRRNNIRKS